MKELDAKVAELESETDRLSSALEAQKRATIEVQTTAAKRVEETHRELQKRASKISMLWILHLIRRPGLSDDRLQKSTNSDRR